jgi:hypothetical protein
MRHNTEEWGVKFKHGEQSVEPELAAPETTDMEPLADDELPAGRIVHDARGNALWKWRGDTSSTESAESTGTTSGILKYIDPADLEIEGLGDEFGSTGGKTTQQTDPGGGYDPYNQGGARHKPGTPGKSGRIKV